MSAARSRRSSSRRCSSSPRSSTAQTHGRTGGRAARRHHAGRVRRVPPRPRRLPRGRSVGRRPRPGVQRHELRGLPQRAGDRRRRRHGGAARGPPQCRRRLRDVRLHRRDALPPVLRAIARLPADASRRCDGVRAARADSAVRRRPRRSDSRRDPAGARGSERPQRRRRQRPGGAGRRRRDRRAPRRPLRLEGAARHAADLRRRRLPQRDGDHQRCVPAGSGVRHHAGADAGLRSDSRSGGHPRSGDAAARHRQLRHLHAVAGAGRSRGGQRADPRRASRSSPRIGCATCHVPGARDGRRARIRSSTARGSRSSRICCCTTSAPATASSRGPPRPTRFARRRCGACASAGRSCTTDRPARSRKPCSGTAARRCSRSAASSGSPRQSAPRCSRSCGRCRPARHGLTAPARSSQRSRRSQSTLWSLCASWSLCRSVCRRPCLRALRRSRRTSASPTRAPPGC